MRKTLFVILCWLTCPIAWAVVVRGTFESEIWWADGIAIVQIAGVQERTIDVKVERWGRDRTGGNSPELRAFRYAIPTCTGGVPEPYSVGDRYLLLMRKPHDEGAGENVHWIILRQIALQSPTLCLDGSDPRPVASDAICSQRYETGSVVDASETFDRCFTIPDLPHDRPTVVSQTCSADELRAWSARSSFHAKLAERALEQIRFKRSRDGV